MSFSEWFKDLNDYLFGGPSGKRARNEKGRFIPDDPATPQINEAYEDGRKPEA